MSCHGTIVDLLRERAAQNPDGVAYMFLGDGEAEDSKVTYSALDARSRAIGAHLASVVPKGERLLLSFPSGMQFIEAFFGCLYASLTAIPAYPLEPAHLNRTLPRCRAILREASPAAALTSAESYGVVREMEREFPDLGRTRWIITEEIPNALGTTWKDPGTSAQMLAVLQYTSGSTSSSKGVMLSHYSILQNERMIAGAFGHQRSLPFVGWVSLPHALGLMYHVLQPLYMGVPSIFMSPEAFLQKPVRWLRAISHYHAQAS